MKDTRDMLLAFSFPGSFFIGILIVFVGGEMDNISVALTGIIIGILCPTIILFIMSKNKDNKISAPEKDYGGCKGHGHRSDNWCDDDP